ncbi:MAG: ABC transporter permease, partial [Planctomycetota bacterium]
MSREVPLVPDKDLSIAFRLTVTAIAGSGQFGNFNLAANQIAPLNAFVPIEWLGEKLDRAARANMILAAGDDQISANSANEKLAKVWQLTDVELELQQVTDSGMIELRSKRIFIDESISTAALAASANAAGVLSYFVNELRANDKTTPYSMVTAIDKRLIDDQMPDDQIVINNWLANDLNAKVGDNIELKYFVLGPMRKLIEKTTTFTVRKIVAMEGLAADSKLMPDFPGLADANNCRDWEPGIPIDLDKIRDKDEDYWDKWKGTPKALVTLAAGQKMWANRYGNLTAVRYPANELTKERLEAKIMSAIEPASLGLYFEPVRQRGLKASAEATDFGGLFLGFSIFLIISGLALTALIFVFGVESRSGQIGTLLALGFKPKTVKRLLLTEGAAIAIAGSICGTALGLFYTKAMIYALATIWKTAVSGTEIQLYANPSTLAGSAIAGIVVSVLAIRLTLRKAVSRPARELLASQLQWQFFGAGQKTRPRAAFTLAALAVAAAVAILVIARAGDSQTMAGAFFGTGALLLIASLALGHGLLRLTGGGYDKPLISLSGLALRNTTRRAGRSLAVIALLGCGVFLVIAVGANRHDVSAEARHRDSGTGGFAIYGESAIGILHDLNTADGRKSLRLKEGIEDIDVVQLRLREGDDASCLNLNRAQKPRLLGLHPEQLKQRGSFGFAQKIKDAQNEDTWELLNRDFGEDVVPAIGDKQMIVWLLGKKI